MHRELLWKKKIFVQIYAVEKARRKEKMLIREMRKKTYKYNSVPLMITYHPAALLRNPSLKKDVWQDFQYIRDFMKF